MNLLYQVLQYYFSNLICLNFQRCRDRLILGTQGSEFSSSAVFRFISTHNHFDKRARERERARTGDREANSEGNETAAARVHHCLPLAWAQNLANCLGPDYRFSPIRRVSIN